MKSHTNDASIERLLNAYNSGNTQKSLVISKYILCNTPELVLGWNILAITLANLGRYEQSIQTFSRALILSPYNPHLCNNLGNALKSKGDLTRARRL